MTLLEPIITVRQPWATAIFQLGKNVENRTWSTDYRGRLWIHSGLRADAEADGDRRLLQLELEELPTGVVLGSVTLVDVVEGSRSRWAEPGRFHWLLTDPRPLASPRPRRGRAGMTWVSPPGLRGDRR